MFKEKDAKISIIGDSIIDRFTPINGPTRKSPEDPDANCWDVLPETNQPGGAGCAARCGVNLGGTVELYSVCGSDGKAGLLRKILAENGINAHLVEDEGRDTTLKSRMVFSTGKQKDVYERQSREPIPKKVEIQLLEEIFKSDAPVFLLSDYGRGVCTPNLVCTVSQFCSVESRKLVVDGRERGKEWYKLNLPHVFLIKPNRREAAAMVGKKEEDLKEMKDVEEAAKTLRGELECNVLITLDKEGALLCSIDSEDFRIYEAENKKPVSVSGAGDTLAVTISLGLSIGMPLEEACKWGMVAAGITVSKPGSEVVTLTEFNAAIQRLRAA